MPIAHRPLASGPLAASAGFAIGNATSPKATASGVCASVIGAGAATAPRPTASGTGSNTSIGSGAATAPRPTASGIGSNTSVGSGAATAPAASAASIGYTTNFTTASPNLGAFFTSGAGYATIYGAAAPVVGALAASGEGYATIYGSASPTLAGLTASGAGYATIYATTPGGVGLGPIIVKANLLQTNSAFAILEIGPFSAAGNALGARQLQGSPLIGPLEASGAWSLRIYGTGGPVLPAFLARGATQYGSGFLGPFVASGVGLLKLTADQWAGVQTVFAPPRHPQAPADISVQPRVLSAPFGPGYPYTLPDGINVGLRSVNLKFEPLTEADFNAIDAFFNAYLNQTFWYLLPDEKVRRRWMMMSRTRRVQPTVWGYDVTLAEQPQL